VQETVQTPDQLTKVSHENAINGSMGREFVVEMSQGFVEGARQFDAVRSDVREALEFLVPMWQKLRAQCTAALTPEEAQSELAMKEGALPYRIREWEGLGMPSEVAEALLRAELQELRTAANRH
jgi:hypothetical protein